MNKLKLRRFKKNFIYNKNKILIFSLVSLLFLFSSGYAILNTVLNINGRAEIVIDEDEGVCIHDLTATYQENTKYSNSDGTWSYLVVVVINNEISEPVDGWSMKVKGPSDLNIESNHAEVVSASNGIVNIEGMQWNSTIYPNSSITIELKLITVEEELNLTYIKVNDCLVHGFEDEEPSEEALIALELAPSESTMAVGETKVLSVVKTPSNSIAQLSWESNNESVATVTQDGLIEAKGKGTATITARSGNITASAVINVVEVTTELTSLALNNTSISIDEGETFNLIAYKTPENATNELTWTSNNMEVATVTQDGKVTGLKEGTATIIVASGNIFAECLVTVNKVELKSLQITPSEYTMTIGEEILMQVTKNPESASTTLLWSSSNPSVAEVSENGRVTALQKGTTIITVTTGTVSAQSTITVESEPEVTLPTIAVNISSWWGEIGNGHQANFEIKITNNSDITINNVFYKLVLPEGTQYNFWQGSNTVNGNEIAHTIQINPKGSVTIGGQIKLPPNYDINEYLPVQVTNIQVQ